MKKQLFLLALTGLGALGWGRASQSNAPSKAQTVPKPQAGAAASRTWPAQSDGFAAVVRPEQAGTTGGAGGKVVAAATLADLEKYAGAPEPTVILIQGAIRKNPLAKTSKLRPIKPCWDLEPMPRLCMANSVSRGFPTSSCAI